MTTATHTPGDWHVEPQIQFYKVCDEQGVTVADIPIQPLDPQEWAECNAHLIAAAPRLLNALTEAQAAIEEATDIMYYGDGQPVTALEGWEIERAYLALCGVLVEVHQAIAAARGEKP